jgi:HPt (histidine-containing phosphotransfer) domain-containing protein
MNNRIKEILCNSIIHIDIGKRRNDGDEDLYEKNLRAFASDKSYGSIVSALQNMDFSMADRFSQRLKIKAYNLGMVRLAKYCDTLCLAIQSGRGAPAFTEEMRDVTTVYKIMMDCITRAFMEPSEKTTALRP